MLQMCRETDESIYLSLDTLPELDVFETLKQLFQTYKYTTFFLDEIHHIKNFDRVLKQIFDFLPVKVICTSSAALSIQESAIDLSRRIDLIKLPPFSYREYLYFKEDVLLEPLTFSAILNDDYGPDYLRYAYSFEHYLTGQLFPFALEEADVLSALKNISQKVLSKDIPSISSLKMEELEIMQKLLAFIGRSKVDGINYSSIAKNLGITKFKAEQYLKLMEKTFLLRIVFPKGSNVMKEPKVLMQVPYRLLYSDYNFAVGGLREDYFVETLTSAHENVFYLKSTRGTKTPDYLVESGGDSIIVEVGGKGKGRQQFKGVSGTKQAIFYHGDIPSGIKKPLFLLGFL